MWLGVRHKVDVMFDIGHFAEVAIPHLVVRLSYLQYLVPSILECAADPHRFVSVPRVVDRFLLRLRNVGLYTGRSSLAEAKLVALDCGEFVDWCFCTYDLYQQYVAVWRRLCSCDHHVLGQSA